MIKNDKSLKDFKESSPKRRRLNIIESLCLKKLEFRSGVEMAVNALNVVVGRIWNTTTSFLSLKVVVIQSGI